MIEWSGMVPHECVSPRRSVSAVHLGPWLFPFTGNVRVLRAAITLGRLPRRELRQVQAEACTWRLASIVR